MKYPHKLRARGLGLSRNVIVLGLVSLCNDASSEMIYPLLPLFITITLGASVEVLGIIEGIAESTASVLKLFSGWLSDKLGRRKTLAVAGYTLSSLTRPLMAMATVSWHVLVVRFGDRVGKGVRTAPRDALIADSTDPASRGRAFGFHRAMDHAGAIIGPLLAMIVLALSSNNYRLVFWLAVIPAMFGVILLILRTQEIKPQRLSSPPSLRLGQFDANFRRFLFVIILFTLGNSSDAFLLLRAKQTGLSSSLIPLLWVFLHVVKMTTSFLGGVWSDRIGRKRTIISGWLLYSFVYGGLALADAPWHIWALMGVYGIFYGLTEGVEKALVADLVSPAQRGTAFGIYNFAIGIGALPASLLMGILWHRIGPGTAFAFGSAMALLASLMIVRVKTSGIGISKNL
jgi:MFS family permease